MNVDPIKAVGLLNLNVGDTCSVFYDKLIQMLRARLRKLLRRKCLSPTALRMPSGGNSA